MSQKPLWKQGRQNIGKILTNLVLHAISDPAIHDKWLPLECFTEHLQSKHPNNDSIQLPTSATVRHLNKMVPQVSGAK